MAGGRHAVRAGRRHPRDRPVPVPDLGTGTAGTYVVLLIETASTEPGADLSPAVAAAMGRAMDLVLEEVST